MVSKVLLEVLYGIFHERFLIINVDKIKNVKKRKNVTEIKFYIYVGDRQPEHDRWTEGHLVAV